MNGNALIHRLINPFQEAGSFLEGETTLRHLKLPTPAPQATCPARAAKREERRWEPQTYPTSANHLPQATIPIGTPDGRVILPVPYISQWSPTARHAPGDCGPACIAMVIHYLTDRRPTVDQVSVACDVPKGAKWASLSQLARGARQYGLKARHVRPLTFKHIGDEIDAGKPVLALVKYDELTTKDDPNQDAKFKGAHFVLCVGYGPDSVIFHDPDRLSGEEFGEFREKSCKVWDRAAGSTSKTPGNAYNFHGMTFDV